MIIFKTALSDLQDVISDELAVETIEAFATHRRYPVRLLYRKNAISTAKSESPADDTLSEVILRAWDEM